MPLLPHRNAHRNASRLRCGAASLRRAICAASQRQGPPWALFASLCALTSCVSLRIAPPTPPLAASWLADRVELDAGLPQWHDAVEPRRQAQRRVARRTNDAGRQATQGPTPYLPPRPAQRKPSLEASAPPVAKAPTPARPQVQTPPPTVAKAPAKVPANSSAGTASGGAVDARAAERVAAAQRLLDRVGNADQPLVDEILHAAGQGIAISSRLVYAAGLLAHMQQEGKVVARGAVAAGDVAFFKDTLDLNGNRRPDDGVTFAAMVERVEPGRVVIIARRGGRVRRLALDPSRPTAVHDEHGQVVNTRLVQWPGQPTAWTTGQCLAAYARP